jgi:hypothetical protein
MASRIDDLLEHIARLERELELNRARAQWRYRIEAGRVRFEHDVYRATGLVSIRGYNHE